MPFENLRRGWAMYAATNYTWQYYGEQCSAEDIKKVLTSLKNGEEVDKSVSKKM